MLRQAGGGRRLGRRLRGAGGRTRRRRSHYTRGGGTPGQRVACLSFTRVTGDVQHYEPSPIVSYYTVDPGVLAVVGVLKTQDRRVSGSGVLRQRGQGSGRATRVDPVLGRRTRRGGGQSHTPGTSGRPWRGRGRPPRRRRPGRGRRSVVGGRPQPRGRGASSRRPFI